jgi:nitrogen-specific signal transduction histidine kinase/ActR/RegA family two-component response regulator
VHVSVSCVNDDNGAIKNIVMVSRDISEEIRLQDQLLQSQKMEAIGTLAGGIAHEFNNVLFAIIGYIELVMDDLPEGSRARINSEKAIGGAERCADMVKQILTFSRPKRTEMIPLDLGALLKEAINFLGSMIPTTIEINHRIQPNLKKISGDATQIHQVLMNLCVNAWHAIEDGKGTISVELNEVELDANFTTLNPQLVPGIYVRLRVTDTGAGISPEIKSKIFDPYFTTKEVGSGTGLGLSVVHGIMLNHNGAITVTSELDKGSTFDVFFPVVAEKAAIGERSSAPGLNPRGNEHVLVVDDEKDLLEMYERQLKRLGYKVTCSGDPDEALELFRHDTHSFDMLLTDLQMPKMTGVELADKIVEIKPGLPVILCSGKNQLASMSDFSRRNIKVMVQKPVRMDEMARTIREALDRER